MPLGPRFSRFSGRPLPQVNECTGDNRTESLLRLYCRLAGQALGKNVRGKANQHILNALVRATREGRGSGRAEP